MLLVYLGLRKDELRRIRLADVDRCLTRAGLSTEWSLHDLRHAAADAIYRVTGDIVHAQQLLRHADVRTTRGTSIQGSTGPQKA
jgi:integrase